MKKIFTVFTGQKWGFSQIRSTLIFIAVLGFLVTGNSIASAEMFIYPAQGQSNSIGKNLNVTNGRNSRRALIRIVWQLTYSQCKLNNVAELLEELREGPQLAL